MKAPKIPNKDIIGTKGKELEGKLILLGVTGSPGVIESVQVAREIMRHGAEVIAVMTQAAQGLIHPNLLEWATGNEVITHLSGRIEHILYTNPGGQPASLFLIAPCTGNTIGKIAAGIDDTPVTSVATAAIGEKIPVLIAPSMHDSMWRNPLVMQNLRRLEDAGIRTVKPRREESKAKIADVETLLSAVISELSEKDLAGMRVLVTGGPTIERIDPIRIITNRSSGRMGVALARVASRRGAAVTLVYGPGMAQPPADCKIVNVETTEEMLGAVSHELKAAKYDIAVLSAAASDFAPTKPSKTKISSHFSKPFQLTLKPTRKILDLFRKLSPSTYLVAFKAEHGVSEEELIERGYRRLLESGADIIAANDVSQTGAGFEVETNEVLLVDRNREVTKLSLAPKEEIAGRILDEVLVRMSKRKQGSTRTDRHNRRLYRL